MKWGGKVHKSWNWGKCIRYTYIANAKSTSVGYSGYESNSASVWDKKNVIFLCIEDFLMWFSLYRDEKGKWYVLSFGGFHIDVETLVTRPGLAYYSSSCPIDVYVCDVGEEFLIFHSCLSVKLSYHGHNSAILRSPVVGKHTYMYYTG